MKILATFDGSKCSEAIVPQLEWLARLADVEFTFLLIAHQPHDTVRARRTSETVVTGLAGATPIVMPAAAPTVIEDRGAAIERTLAEESDYLQDIVSRMPRGPKYSVEVAVANDAAAAIIRYAMEHKPDLIVMGTHGETGMIHRLFGDVAEQIVRSGVAPVLLVHSIAANRPAAK